MKYSSVREINDAVRSMERRIVEENLPLREETRLVREIRNANLQRNEVQNFERQERMLRPPSPQSAMKATRAKEKASRRLKGENRV